MDLAGRNVVLIGMPGVGKSTTGVLLAKVLSRNFIDTDVYIQAREGRRLQDIIDNEGLEVFCRLEAEYLLSLKCRDFVIATGGSVVYSDAAMKYLKQEGIILHLELPESVLESRVNDMDSRGLVIETGQTFNGLYEDRMPLYQSYADITLDCEDLTHEQVSYAAARALEEYSG